MKLSELKNQQKNQVYITPPELHSFGERLFIHYSIYSACVKKLTAFINQEIVQYGTFHVSFSWRMELGLRMKNRH